VLGAALARGGGGSKLDQVRRLKDLPSEGARLKKLVADQALDISVPRQVSQESFWCRRLSRG
jgi:hypothetical protein